MEYRNLYKQEDGVSRSYEKKNQSSLFIGDSGKGVKDKAKELVDGYKLFMQERTTQEM